MDIERFETATGEPGNTSLNDDSVKREGHYLAATTIIGDEVRNYAGESLGKIEDLVIDFQTGRISYAVLSFGGFLGVGTKLFAVPIQLLHPDTRHGIFILNIEKQILAKAPGFDKSNWPDFASEDWQAQISVYYGVSSSDLERPRH